MNWLLLKNSLLVSAGAALLATLFGFLAALWLTGLAPRLRQAFLALAIISLALPPFLVTNCWLDLLGAAGVWRSWLPLDILTLPGAVCILTLLLWPIPLLLVSSAWRRLEPAQLEADPAVIGWALMRVLLLPLAWSAMLQAAVITFVLALSNFAVPAILQVKVLPAEMWIRFTTAFDSLGVLRMSWPLVVGPLLLLIWFARRSTPWPHLESPVPASIFRRQVGTVWFQAAGVCTRVLFAFSVGVPAWQLGWARRTWTELPSAVAAGQSAIWNSLWFAAAAATATITISLVFATRRRYAPPFNPYNIFNSFNFLSSLLWLPFLLPGVLLGIALITVFNRPWTTAFYQSAGIVILAFAIRYLALGWHTVAHAAETVDRDLIDVARLEGASRWQMLRYVQWPQIKTQVAAAWYIVFLLCLWDVESMILVYPPGGETLALRIFNLLHYGHNAQVNALCLVLLGVAVLPLGAWCLVRGAWPRVGRLVSYGKPYATRVSLAVLCLPLLQASCSPPAHLDSKLFDRVEIIGTRGVGIGQLNKPRSVAVDRQDNVYAVDMTGRVQKFSPGGQFIWFRQMPQTDLGKPKGMGRDRDGNIIVIEPHYQRLNYFSPDGQLLAQWGEKGTNAGQLIMPRAVAVNSRGEIFVSEYGQVERIQKFAPLSPLINTPLQRGGAAAMVESNRFSGLPTVPDTAKAVPSPSSAADTRLKPGVNETSQQPASAGASSELIQHPRLLAVIGHAGTGPGEFNRPEGLWIDAQDRLYVADSCNHRIQVFSSDGKFLRTYGRPGKGKGELSYPYDICVDGVGRQYVCEFGNSRIQVFDANDQPLEIIGGPGADPGQFANPWGVALDSAGDLYVADSQNHRVQKLVSKQRVIGNQYSVFSERLVAESFTGTGAGADCSRRFLPLDHWLLLTRLNTEY
jgi:iron(III) transport system permease protein